jgi:hypothetical protein
MMHVVVVVVVGGGGGGGARQAIECTTGNGSFCKLGAVNPCCFATSKCFVTM